MNKADGTLTAPPPERADDQRSVRVRRRRKYLVDAKFQLRYVSVAFLAVLILTLALKAVLVYVGMISPIEGQYSLVLSIKWSVVGFIVTVVIVLVATYFNIRATHRVAGPMFRFKESTKTVASGDLTQLVRIRRTDELQDYAELFNGMTAALRERLSAAKDRADELEDALAYAGRLAQACTTEPELREEIERAARASRRLATELAFFKTRPDERPPAGGQDSVR
ncbi:MAG: HAMP domain-containing protein [Armatimonadota bacterium]